MESMDRLPYGIPTGSWPPNLRPILMRVLRPPRIWLRQKRQERLWEVEVRGVENVRAALKRGCGVLIAS